MKKMIYFCLSCLGVILLSGCGNEKKLECTLTSDAADYGRQEETYKITFKDDEIIKQVQTSKITMSEILAEYKEDFYNSTKAQFDDLKDTKGVTVDTSLNDNVINTEITINIKELNDEIKSRFNIDETNSYDELKAEFINNGYTCK